MKPSDVAPPVVTATMRGSNLSIQHPAGQRVHVAVVDRNGLPVYPVTVRYYTHRVQLHIDKEKATTSAWPLRVTMTHVGKPVASASEQVQP